jgi:magnesium transporter
VPGGAPPDASAMSSFENIFGVRTGAPAPGGGHDRPYRFSFYSNALSATIHARSLAELPADGQSFEQLFQGVHPGTDADAAGTGPPSAHQTQYGSPAPSTMHALAARRASAATRPGGFVMPDAPAAHKGAVSAGAPLDGNTWWLDVLNPTDEEMKMLSKVFGIHPLTTEDILMEETREKIELFRNYYLVCFRGFDQDPYSPTHLEPLNMYIIVFREGTLSVGFSSLPFALAD